MERLYTIEGTIAAGKAPARISRLRTNHLSVLRALCVSWTN